jgi:WD40 repeat protein
MWDWTKSTLRSAMVLSDANAVSLGAPSPDGRYFLTANQHSNALQLWRLADKSMQAEFVGHRARVRELGFAEDGKWFATADETGNVRVWTLPLEFGEETITGEIDEYGRVDTAIDNNLAVAAVSLGDANVHLWDLRTRREAKTLALGSPVQGVTFSSDGTLLGAVTHDGLRVLRASTWTDDTALPLGDLGKFVAFSHNGHLLATANTAIFGKLSVIELVDRKLVVDAMTRQNDHSVNLQYGLFSPDDQYLLTARYSFAGIDEEEMGESKVTVWNSDNWSIKEEIPLGEKMNPGFVLNHKGNMLLVGRQDDLAVCLLSFPDCHPLQVFKSPSVVRTACFSPTENLVAVGSDDGVVRLFNTSNGDVVREWNAHAAPILDVLFGETDGILVTCSEDTTLKAWDANGRSLIAELTGSQQPVVSASWFFPSDSLLSAAYGMSVIYQAQVFCDDPKRLMGLADDVLRQRSNRNVRINKKAD